MPEYSRTKKQSINEGMVSTISWFSRNASAASFAALAGKMGIAIGGEPKKRSRKDTAAAVLDAVASMDETGQDDIGRMLEELRTIGATKGSNQLIGDFLMEKKIGIPDGFHEAKCADKVIWCHINLSPELWAELKSRTLIESFTHWRGYNLVFREGPEQGII